MFDKSVELSWGTWLFKTQYPQKCTYMGTLSKTLCYLSTSHRLLWYLSIIILGRKQNSSNNMKQFNYPLQTVMVIDSLGNFTNRSYLHKDNSWYSNYFIFQRNFSQWLCLHLKVKRASWLISPAYWQPSWLVNKINTFTKKHWEISLHKSFNVSLIWVQGSDHDVQKCNTSNLRKERYLSAKPLLQQN